MEAVCGVCGVLDVERLGGVEHGAPVTAPEV